MTPEQIALVREGFALIAPQAEAAGMSIYERLFTLDPSLRRLFAGDMRVHARNLMGALGMVVRSLDDVEPALVLVRALGRRHAGYGVLPEHVAAAGAAVLDALAAELGDAFTPTARDAWSATYAAVAGAMIDGMAEPVAPRPARGGR